MVNYILYSKYESYGAGSFVYGNETHEWFEVLCVNVKLKKLRKPNSL
jgi:hypothetical protein